MTAKTKPRFRPRIRLEQVADILRPTLLDDREMYGIGNLVHNLRRVCGKTEPDPRPPALKKEFNAGTTLTEALEKLEETQ